jgi:hypothetical protein
LYTVSRPDVIAAHGARGEQWPHAPSAQLQKDVRCAA